MCTCDSIDIKSVIHLYMKEGKLFIRTPRTELPPEEVPGKLYIKNKTHEAGAEVEAGEGEIYEGQIFRNRDMKEVFTIMSIKTDERGEHVLLESEKGVRVSRDGSKFRTAIEEGVWESLDK